MSIIFLLPLFMYHAATCRYLIRLRLARASRMPWYKWNFFETLSLICFSMPLSRSVSLSPSSCASLSLSPCKSSLLSLCSPYNQVFFKLLSKVPCSSSVSHIFISRLVLHSPSSFKFLLYRHGETWPCWEGTPISGQYRAGICVQPITLYTHTITAGSRDKTDCDTLHFSS